MHAEFLCFSHPLAVLVPDLDDPLRGAGDEDVGDEGVPLDVVHRGVVGLVGVQVAGAVLGGAQVYHAWEDRKMSRGTLERRIINLHQFQPGMCCHHLA